MAKKQFDKSILKDPFIKDFIKYKPINYQTKLKEKWSLVGCKLKDIINVDEVNYTHLAAIADILYERREDDNGLFKHAENLKNDYVGASEFKQFLSMYRNEEVIPVKITIEYKTLNKNGNKSDPRSIDDLKNISALSVHMKGYNLVKVVAKLMSDRSIDKYLSIMEGFERYPPIDINEYPAKKKDFITLHAKKGRQVIAEFLGRYNLNDREVKLATMKTLAFIHFIVPYDQYRKSYVTKGRAKVRAENEYYIQRYTDLIKTTGNNAQLSSH